MERVQYLRATTSQNLASGALSFTTSFKCNFKLCQILLKASQNISETITVQFKSKDGTNYDVVLDSTSLSNAQNYVFRPTGQCIFMDGDEVKITCTNAGNSGIVYVTVIAEPFGKQP